ncbi:Endochitinase 2 [Talaromyces atroroseus]|uniref:Endochitinase 2 n=1 Tax=Talaromyces atroroseus TaxID=1441469 RepID=A0A225BEA9_TALAT|nr:Endochitinase 2 [Talaromyces atroroseus]OKL64357.1 Endochitinase 2 [Talaromyces atroroseus]
MHFSTLAGASLLASAAMAYPHNMKRTSTGQTVVYWGQNYAGAPENNDLSTYCDGTSGIDIIVLAFLNDYGTDGETIPYGTIGQNCQVSSSGTATDCDDLAAAITTCQDAGITVLLSLGGSSGSYTVTSQSEGETIGQYLWDAYASPNATSSSSTTRPFGDAYVNGWDFDIEANPGEDNSNYQYLISTLRSNFDSDPDNTYYITGAPQCPIPEPNMQSMIENSKFDYLWIQFYNNPGCSTNSGTNYGDWISNIANTSSADAKLFIGVPAGELAANGQTSGEVYYLEPSELATIVANYSSEAAFGGIMLWDAGFSDNNVNDGCTYAQEASSILSTGSPCS